MSFRLPLSVAALRLGRTYHQIREQVLRGELAGGRDEFGRFYVTEAALAEAVPARRDAHAVAPAGRSDDDAAA